MHDGKTTRRSYAHLGYALVSVACPFIAFGLISIYQEYAYAHFWGPKPLPLDDADINAGAIMGFVIIVQAILAIGVGSLFGLVFAGVSLKRKPRVLSFGTAAFVVNLIPVMGVVTLFSRGRI